jgi:uncharacterized damage-inducible protein DinB
MHSEIARLFLVHSCRKLQQMAGQIETCLTRLTEEQVWQRGSENENAVGNLVLHLCGNVQQWIGSAIAGEPDIRQREAEFSAHDNFSKEELVALLQQTIACNVAIIDQLKPERLTETITTQDGPRSALETIYQVVGHFQQHTGQIVFATKLRTGSDFRLYVPPSKP